MPGMDLININMQVIRLLRTSAILAAIREKYVFLSCSISVLPADGFPGTKKQREKGSFTVCFH